MCLCVFVLKGGVVRCERDLRTREQEPEKLPVDGAPVFPLADYFKQQLDAYQGNCSSCMLNLRTCAYPFLDSLSFFSSHFSRLSPCYFFVLLVCANLPIVWLFRLTQENDHVDNRPCTPVTLIHVYPIRW
jgi:hypothetical protein